MDPNCDSTVEMDDLLRLRTRKFLAERELPGQVDEDTTSETNAPAIMITGGVTWNENSETKKEGEVKTENEGDLSPVSVRTLAQTTPSCQLEWNTRRNTQTSVQVRTLLLLYQKPYKVRMKQERSQPV